MIIDMLDIIICYLMVFITLKLTIKKIMSRFYKFEVFFVYWLTSLIMGGPISFLVNYKLFCLVSILSDAILTLLICFF